MAVTYTIGTLATLTGLSPHTIRAWERRYQALTPSRTDTNRRVYVDEDVQRLSLLRGLVEGGQTIGQIAHLPTDQLRALHSGRAGGRATSDPGAQPVVLVASDSGDAPRWLATCLDAVERLDAHALEGALVHAAASMGIMHLLGEVVVPLLREIGLRWQNGFLSIAQEHMASAVLRTHLERVRTSFVGHAGGPRLVVTTPRNQFHELGSIMAAIAAAAESWNVTYLGPNLPAGEIAHAVRLCEASALAIGITYPRDDSTLPHELARLRHAVGDRLPILAGGQAALDYEAALAEIDAEICRDLGSFRAALARIRGRLSTPAS